MKIPIDNLRVWGCKAFVQIPPPDRKGKGNNVRWIGIFVGYSARSQEWLILDPRTNKIKASSDVFVAYQAQCCKGSGDYPPVVHLLWCTSYTGFFFFFSNDKE